MQNFKFQFKTDFGSACPAYCPKVAWKVLSQKVSSTCIDDICYKVTGKLKFDPYLDWMAQYQNPLKIKILTQSQRLFCNCYNAIIENLQIKLCHFSKDSADTK